MRQDVVLATFDGVAVVYDSELSYARSKRTCDAIEALLS